MRPTVGASSHSIRSLATPAGGARRSRGKPCQLSTPPSSVHPSHLWPRRSRVRFRDRLRLVLWRRGIATLVSVLASLRSAISVGSPRLLVLYRGAAPAPASSGTAGGVASGVRYAHHPSLPRVVTFRIEITSKTSTQVDKATRRRGTRFAYGTEQPVASTACFLRALPPRPCASWLPYASGCGASLIASLSSHLSPCRRSNRFAIGCVMVASHRSTRCPLRLARITQAIQHPRTPKQSLCHAYRERKRSVWCSVV